MLNSVLGAFNKKSAYIKIRTFTYFIPAPPSRKTGYQEKEFDSMTEYLLGKNFDLIDIKMESYSQSNSAGVWMICILGAKTQEAANMNLEIDYAQVVQGQEQYIETDPLIEHDH